MIVTLIYKEHLKTTILPKKVEGQFWLETEDDKQAIGIEAQAGKWYIKSNKKAKILDEKCEEIQKLELVPNMKNTIKIKDEEAILFSEPLTDDRQQYTKKIIKNNAEIKIGRDEISNTIVFKNKFVSYEHATLEYRNKYWLLRDNDSTNGIFVNGKREKSKSLDPGDVVYIMGLKIIVFYDFIMLNNPDNLVTVRDNGIFEPNEKEETVIIQNDDELEDEIVKNEYFYRSPRVKNNIEKERIKIKIDTPPEKQDGEKMPMALTIGPSITMGLASLATAAVAINGALSTGDIQTNMPTIVMSASMLLGTLLWPMITNIYENVSKKKQERERKEKYLQYLEDTEQKINLEINEQERILKENFVTIDECEERILRKKSENRTGRMSGNLWERKVWEDDFLKLRLGIGNLPLNADIIYPERKFSLKEDELLDKMYELCERPKILNRVPITLSLYDEYITGVVGERKKVIEFAKGLIVQIAALYSYDEVKMIFLYNKNEENEFEFVKWLPHVFSNDKQFRFVATNLEEVKEISYYLDDEINARLELDKKQKEEALPYYVVFSLDKGLALKSEILNQIYSKNKNVNVSVINFFEEMQDLPKECTTIIEIKDKEGEIKGSDVKFKTEEITADPMSLSKKLANTPLNGIENGYKMPSTITFLDMLQVGKIEHLNVINRWTENDPTKSLAVPIGVDQYGGLFKLDLCEKFHGPHGLIAGTTGSGKSEFIATYILSLAVNYSPQEVSFILIDYKGGGMAKLFEKLPHTAGIVTNLADTCSLERALIAINSERDRRLTLFNEVASKTGINHMDIYKYQSLYRDQKVEEPLSHLFIICDEFAELKSQKEEYLNELNTIARTGRSVGIHLILATQKPSGVVDKEIWSNSKFRVCLKVQEKEDSIEVLGRPDAAMLKDRGRFYLQVGYNDIFEMGQSAWIGAQYIPKEKYQKEKDNGVIIIDRNARVLKEVKPDINKSNNGGEQKQLDAIIEYLNNIAEKEKIKARHVWLEPLKEKIYLKELESKDTEVKKPFYINPIIGKYDDPVNQKQELFKLDISKKGNTIIYGSQGSGKTMLLNTMITSIIDKYSKEEVNLYLLDFESQTLKAFEKASQVKEVILDYEEEKINTLFKNLRDEIENRKKKFVNFDGRYQKFVEKSSEKIPNIIVVLNNYANYSEIYGSKERELSYLIREGAKYGIYFVITASMVGVIKNAILAHFGQSIVLRFYDEIEYTKIFSRFNSIDLPHYEGRGLIKINKDIFEFQTARVTEEGDANE